MVHQCAHCHSFDIIAGQDMVQCLKCGLHTRADGTAVTPPPPAAPLTWAGRANIDGH